MGRLLQRTFLLLVNTYYYTLASLSQFWLATTTLRILAGFVSATSHLQTILFIHVEVASYLQKIVFMNRELTSPGTLTSTLSNIVMAESRFATLIKEDLDLLLDDKDVKSTKRATKSALKVFHQYLKEKKAGEPQTKETLANVLKLFYAEARKTDGTSYSKSTLNSLRFGLNRHFKATRGFDIINDSAFTDANKVFGAKCVDLKRQGLKKINFNTYIAQNSLCI